MPVQILEVSVVVRNIRVIGGRTFRQAIDAVGYRHVDVNEEVAAVIPDIKSGYSIAKQRFINIGTKCVIPVDEFEGYLSSEGYKLNQDFYSLAAINEFDPAFVLHFSNATIQKDTSGRFVLMCFRSDHGTRKLYVGRNVNACGGYDWFPVSEI